MLLLPSPLAGEGPGERGKVSPASTAFSPYYSGFPTTSLTCALSMP
jgi:hypothetical protein